MNCLEWLKKRIKGEPGGKPEEIPKQEGNKKGDLQTRGEPEGRSRDRKHYRGEEEGKLRELVRVGKTKGEISRELGRSERAIYKKIRKMKLQRVTRGAITELLRSKGELEGQVENIKGEIAKLTIVKGELEGQIELLKGKYEKIFKDYEQARSLQNMPEIMELIKRREKEKIIEKPKEEPDEEYIKRLLEGK